MLLKHTAALNQQQIYLTAMDTALQAGWLASQYPGQFKLDRRIVLTPWEADASHVTGLMLVHRIREACQGRWGVDAELRYLNPNTQPAPLFGREDYRLIVGGSQLVLLSVVGQSSVLK